MRNVPRPSHPHACPAVRDHLLDQWRPGRTVRRAIDAMPGDWNATVLNAAANRTKGAWEEKAIEQAALWWVSPEMMDVLEAAAPQVPDDHVLRLEDVPTPYGLAFWPRSFVGLDANSGARACHVDAVVWGPVVLPPGTDPDSSSPDKLWAMGMSSYRLLDCDAGLETADLALAHTTGALAGATMEPTGERYFGPESEGITNSGAVVPLSEPQRAMAYRAHGYLWCPLGRSDWVVGKRVDHRLLRHDAAHESEVEDRRLLSALWTLSMTPAVAETTVEHPPRAVARKAQRQGRDASVRVVYLRRRRNEPEGEPGEGGGRDWSCRWIVGIHPRMQPYGPGRSMRKLIWVGPYEKGPADKPLRVKQPVRAWVR